MAIDKPEVGAGASPRSVFWSPITRLTSMFGTVRPEIALDHDYRAPARETLTM